MNNYNLCGQCNFIDSIKRANSHFVYWKYRKTLNNGGPTFLRACHQWWRRFIAEWLGIGNGA